MILDFLILALLIYLFLRGASLGFLLSLAGPLAFITATAAAIYYYNITKDLKIAFVIGLVGPFVLRWLLIIGMRATGLVSKSEKSSASILSGVAGAFITAVWGMCFVLPVVWILTLFPAVSPPIEFVSNYVKTTRTYQWTLPLMKSIHWLPGVQVDPSKPVTVTSSTNPQQLSPGFQAISQDPRMQALLKDPKVVKALEAHDFTVLFSNPKFQELLQDPEFIKKALAVYGQMPPAK